MELIKKILDFPDIATYMSYAGMAITGIFLVIVLWNVFRGFSRGLSRQISHTVCALVAMVIAVVVSASLWTFLIDKFNGQSLTDILINSGIEIPSEALSVADGFKVSTVTYLLALPAGVLLMPIVFTSIFFVANLALKPVHLIISVVLRLVFGQGFLRRILGMAIGLVEGVLTAAIILLPFAAFADLADTAIAIYEDAEEGENKETIAEFRELLSPVTHNGIIMAIDSMGGLDIIHSIASFTDGDMTIDTRDEFDGMVRIVAIDARKLKDTNWNSLTPEDKVHIDSIVDLACRSDYIATILTDALGSIGIAFDGGLLDSVESLSVLGEFCGIFKDLTREELPDVLSTFKNFYYLLSDEGVLVGFADDNNQVLIDAFTKQDEEGKTVYDKMTAILESNDRTAPIMTNLTKMTLSLLTKDAGNEFGTDVVYDDVKSSVNSALSELDTSKSKEEQNEQMFDSLKLSFADNGVDVDDEVTAEIAEYIVENYAEKGSVSDEEFNRALMHYYQSSKDTEAAE